MSLKDKKIRGHLGSQILGITFTAIAALSSNAFAQQTSTDVTPASQAAVDDKATRPTPLDYEHPGGRDIEDLNMRGGYLKMPPFSETVDGLKNPVRQDLAKQGIGYYDIDDDEFTYNTTTPPVPLADQTFIGQRPTWKSSHYPFMTWDLRQLGIHGGQLMVMGAIQNISWNAGGPNAIQFGNISYYQSLFGGHLELKGGYIDNDFEYVGTAIGGQASSGSLGVFASLPFEVGMSYLPMTTPAFNVNVHYPHNLYSKIGFQRSMDPAGGVTQSARDTVGLRWKPKGDGLLTIYEGGYQHASDEHTKQLWVRGGFMYNTTHFANAKTGGKSTNNYLTYLLADRQLWQPDKQTMAYRGLYGGFSAMAAPAQQNAYSQYYEARLYMRAPFAERPADMASIVSSHTTYSPYTKRNEAAEGLKYWNSATSLTGSYTMRFARGIYFSPGLSYTHGPEIAPKAKSSLNLLAQFSVFF